MYVVFSFIWWMYLLQKNNREDYETLIARERAVFTYNGGTEAQFYKTADFEKLYRDFNSKKWMLLGEGTIFIVLISLGFWRIRKSFSDEIILTRQQNNFLLSITHELKSPLASLKLSVQTLQKRDLDKEQIQRLANISMDDIDRLENLVENILLASKIDSSNFQLNKDFINLSQITQNIFDRIQEKFKGQRRFEAEIEKDVYVHADRLSFTSVIYNLIENAIKYSKEGAFIKVIVFGDDKHAYFHVADTGIGIPEKEKLKIFDRFYRIGSEDTRTTKGTGLGLFIVKQIVAFHDGNIEVKNNDPKGSIFQITIPVA
ncbi:MAG: GHKL domain-containing protein [Fimbriimonadaceae bacterium]|nr:GHKL domain-containing protein [Chitinophagales bacterium]